MTLCQGRGCRFLMRPRQPNQISGQSLVGTAVTAERVSHTGEIPYTKGFRGQLRSRTFRAHLFKAARAMCLYVPKEHQGVLFFPGGGTWRSLKGCGPTGGHLDPGGLASEVEGARRGAYPHSGGAPGTRRSGATTTGRTGDGGSPALCYLNDGLFLLARGFLPSDRRRPSERRWRYCVKGQPQCCLETCCAGRRESGADRSGRTVTHILVLRIS